MDQATFEGLLKNFVGRAKEAKVRDVAALPGQAGQPVVVMVHGIGGNAMHWSDPTALDPNSTWLFDLKAEPPPAGTGILLSPPYRKGSTTDWARLLHDNKLTVVNWSISRPDDLLQYAVAEMVTLLRTLEETVFTPYAQDAAKTKTAVPALVILCHSRGGLVTRAALKQLGSAGVPHLRKVITLSTPHRGSYMPRIANDYNTRLGQAVDFSALAGRLPFFIRGFFEQAIDRYVDTLANRVREAMLHSFGVLAQGPGFGELIPDSATMKALAQNEQPLPGVQYWGFGGSNPVFTSFYLSGLGQSFYLMSAVGSFLIERIGAIPGVAQAYGGLAEMSKGDSAVGLASSRWPDQFKATHQDVEVNHMQALVDPVLQHAVLNIIRR
jgi:pimeloyl-ACP methyl ester carboxylesterase